MNTSYKANDFMLSMLYSTIETTIEELANKIGDDLIILELINSNSYSNEQKYSKSILIKNLAQDIDIILNTNKTMLIDRVNEAATKFICLSEESKR